MEKFLKDPNAVLDYKFDWSLWLQSGEFINSFSVIVPTGITLGSSQNQTTAVVAWLSGGTAGKKYTVTCRITTNANRTDDRSMEVSIAER